MSSANSKSNLREVILHEDLFSKLIEYLESPHAAMFMRINNLFRTHLDKDIYRRIIQEKNTSFKKEMGY